MVGQKIYGPSHWPVSNLLVQAHEGKNNKRMWAQKVVLATSALRLSILQSLTASGF